MPTPGSLTLDKAISLLTLVVADRGERPLADLAKQAELPQSTAHRILVTLQRRGFIARAKRGCYLPGPALMRLGRADEFHSVLRRVGASIVADLARRTGFIANLAVLEGEMITFLVRRGNGSSEREGTQLEAYCAALGKVLLAAMSTEEIESYLDTGPFIRLTPATIIDPDELRRTLQDVRLAGHACDNGEILPDLRCVAVPVRNDEGDICAALSLATFSYRISDVEKYLPILLDAAERVEARLAPRIGIKRE